VRMTNAKEIRGKRMEFLLQGPVWQVVEGTLNLRSATLGRIKATFKFRWS
jgi:hypothetical protein